MNRRWLSPAQRATAGQPRPRWVRAGRQPRRTLCHPPLPSNKSERQAGNRTLARQALAFGSRGKRRNHDLLWAPTCITHRATLFRGWRRSFLARPLGRARLGTRMFGRLVLDHSTKGMPEPGPRRRTTSQRRLARHTSRRSNTKAGVRPARRARRLLDPMLCRSQLPFPPLATASVHCRASSRR